MTYEEFQEYVRTKCVYTAIHLDGEGREILVIPMLDAFAMVNDAPKREWVGLTDEEIDEIGRVVIGFNSLSGWENEFGLAIETKLKEKNGG